MSGQDIDGGHLVAHPQIDTALAVLLGRTRDQQITGLDIATDPVGDAARRVGGVVAPLECDHLDVLPGATLGGRGGRHAGSVSADHHEARGHGVHV